MRKLLNTLYITSEDKYLSLENNNVVIWDNDTRVQQYPLGMLEGIVTFSYKGASPALMGACAKQRIQLSFMTPHGKFLARISSLEHSNVLLRRTQYRIADDPQRSCRIARNFIFGKTYNMRWVLGRTVRDHAMRIDTVKLNAVIDRLVEKMPLIAQAESMEQLRGLEGNAARDYFSVFDEMVLNQKVDFTFDGRHKRPPTDNVNAMLSFVYVILANDCASALESVGLDAQVGFMHTDRSGRESLSLDLVEELRAPVADRLVITMINNRMIHDKDFDRHTDGSVMLNDTGRKAVLKAYQTHKKEIITHPYLEEKIEWGLVPYVQAQLLSRLLRNDIDEYPPFLWK